MNYEKLMSKKNSDGKDAVDFLNEASDLIDKDKYKNASVLLTEAIGLCGHPRLHFNRGYCYHQMKDYKKAISDFKKGISNDRGSDLLTHEKQRLYLYLGIIYEETGEKDDAIEAYKKAADWGYAGAITRLEKMGITYVPQSTDQADEENIAPAAGSKSATVNKRRNSGASEKTASNSFTAPSSDLKQKFYTPPKHKIKKKSKIKFILPVVIGLICGAAVVIIIQNLPEKSAVNHAVKQPAVIKAVVIADTLSLRADPSVNADILKILNFGYVVEITGDEANGFTPIEHEGVKGWVDSNWIEIEK